MKPRAKLFAIAILCILPVVSGTLLAGTLVAQAPLTISEQYLFQAANAERVQRGLPALRWDGALFRSASNHAVEMAKRQSISHQYPGEAELSARGKLAGARFSTIAENVAMAPSAVKIQTAWMHSPGHRANLLDPTLDSVGISVLARAGELYAVEDFDRSVASMTLAQQEQRVGSLIQSASGIDVLPASAAARRTCTMNTGYAGSAQPGFVMRYTAGDLTRLPAQLTSRLETGRYHHAAVGACQNGEARDFTTFRIAVMLYP